MRKSQALIIALSTGLLLTGCANGVSSKMDGQSSFLEVAGASELKIASTNINIDAVSSSGGNNSSSGSTRKCAYYLDGNFSISMNSDNHIGYTIHANDNDQYLLIDTKKSEGTIYATDAQLAAERKVVEAQIAKDYSELAAIYEDIKASASKSASELGFDTYEVAGTVGENVAGYNTLGVKTEQKDGGTVETKVARYLMMDLIGGKWAFTNYAKRQQVVTTDANGVSDTVYTVSNYQIEVVEEYETANLSLSNYTLVVDGFSSEGISFEGGCPLTSK